MGLLLVLRPPDPRSGRRPAAGQVEQGRVLQGARPPRPDARHRRAGPDRPGNRGAGPGVRDAGLAWSRNLTHEEADRLGIAYAQTPLEVARLADAVTINVAANAETEAPGERGVPRGDEAGRVPHQHLARLGGGRGRAGAGGRGTRAPGRPRRLPERAGRRRRASSTARIREAPGVYGTHHVGASTDQAQVAIAHEVIRIVQAFQATGEVPNCVNRLARELGDPRARRCGTATGPGVLAHVFGVLAERRSTWKKSRTSSITAPRPRSRGSISTARRAPARWSAIRSRATSTSSAWSSTEIDGRTRRPVSRPHLQLQRRPRGPARARAQEGAAGHLERRRQRHRHHGAQPSRQGVRQDHRRGGAGLPRSGRHPRQLPGAVPAGRRLAPVLRWCR